MNTKDIVYIALFTALIAALGVFPPLTVPVIAVPITAQTLGVMLAGGVLGAKRGALAIVLFLILVAVGLPLLSGGRGGLAVFSSVTAGFLLGWIVGAYVVGFIVEKNWHNLNFLSALIAGVIGVSIIMGARMGGGVDLYGLGLCVIGVLALTIATLVLRGATSGGNFLMVVGLQMLVGSAALFMAAAAFETPRVEMNLPLVLAFSYTTLVTGLIATLVWFFLVNRIGAVRAATFHFLNPFIGVSIAAVVLSEALDWHDFLGVAIIALGILAVQLSKQKPVAS
mgnify:CR=1 FL=1